MKTTSDQPAIRRAKMQDAAALKNCIERAYAPVKLRLKDLPDVSAGIEQNIAGKIVFVAEFDGNIAGCAFVGLNGTMAHLANIAVDPAYGGKGIAKALISSLESCAKKQGATEICLATHIGMPENVALYTHLGWHETSRTGNKVLMQKNL